MNEFVKAGYGVTCKNKEMVVTRKEERLPIEVRNCTPARPNEVCFRLIDKNERSKGAKIKSVKPEKSEDDFELKNIWPQLSKVFNWIVKNNFDKA